MPIVDFKQHQLLEDMLAQTASTSLDQEAFKTEQKPKVTGLKKRTVSGYSQESTEKEMKKSDKAISNIQKPIQWVDSEIEARVESCEIGMQYSERKGDLS